LIASALAAVALVCPLAGCAPRRTAIAYPAGSEGGPPKRGGHAIFVREEDPDYLDPALSYGTYSAAVDEALFHTLLDYDGVPGPAGAALHADLAVSLPEVREGGTLYAFRVRPDAKFGAPLHRHIVAADFKYAMERLFKVSSPSVAFYRRIVGAERALAGRDSVLPGVIARGDSLYFRLTQPDPTFIQVLSMPFTAPIAREMAEKYPGSMSQHTVATGPFQVAEFVPRRRLLLVRNPDYCGTPAWLDTFELRLGVTTTNGVALIRRGQIDGGFFDLPAADFARLRRDPYWSRQIDVADGLSTDYLFMNVRKPPFNDVRVRQAISWAIDRRAVLKVWAGKGVTAGEFVPLGMPGARALHAYEGPDLPRARRLLAAAGYPHGFETTLYGWTTHPGPLELTVIQQQLAEVGIRARLDLGESVGYTSMAQDTSRHIAFGIYQWTADYPDPSNFFDTLLNGRRIAALFNNDLSLFDDSHVNDAIERAMATADDSLRARRWTDVDRAVMREAPIVTLTHPYEARLYAPRLGGWYRHITRILKLEDLYVKSAPPPPALAAARASGERSVTPRPATARGTAR
jgi:ABC-type transport system substrate-binding protein